MRSTILLIIISVVVLHAPSCSDRTDASSGGNPASGNVIEKNFEKALENYFHTLTKKEISVEYEMLRFGGTETGIAFPKFYAWVIVRQGGSILTLGAVRVAKIDDNEFEITHFLTRSEVRENPDKVFQIFPRPVGELILAKANPE